MQVNQPPSNSHDFSALRNAKMHAQIDKVEGRTPQPAPTQFNVTVIRAQDLPPLRRKFLPCFAKDRKFFVTASDGPTTKKTTVVQSVGQAVRWNETLDAFVLRPSSHLILCLYAKKLIGKDILVGKLEIPFDSFTSSSKSTPETLFVLSNVPATPQTAIYLKVGTSSEFAAYNIPEPATQEVDDPPDNTTYDVPSSPVTTTIEEVSPLPAGDKLHQSDPVISASIATPAFTKLLENTAIFAMKVHSGTADNSLLDTLDSTSKDPEQTLTSGTSERSPDMLNFVDRANALTAEFEKTHDIQHSDRAISTLDSILGRTSDDDPDRHYLLFNLALTLCRRVEIQVSEKPIETLLDLHRVLTRCLFLLRQAVNGSPATFNIKLQYLAQLGHTATLWSTVLSSDWSNGKVLALLAQLRVDRAAADDPTAEKVTGFVSAIVMASTLSTAFTVTQNPVYRNEGREMYRHTLGSMRELLPLDAIIDPISSMDFLRQIQALNFMTECVIPFIVQLMALLMQRLIEVPLSAVLGRRAAALAAGKGFYQRGVEWLEQCLALVWGQLNLRAPAPLDATRVQGVQAEPEGRMGRIVLAFLGLLADGGVCITHPERIASFLMVEWFKLRGEVSSDPIYKDLFKPHSFSHILNAARTAPVVMLNLWGSQCDAIILLGEGESKRVLLHGVTEDFAATLHSNFREGLQASHFRSRGVEPPDVLRASSAAPMLSESAIHRVLARLWEMVVKPILNEMKLEPVESAELDPPRLTWCPTGPTSFFPLHAAGLYNSQERGSKTYEYVASSYTPTLSILADANVALSAEPEPFKGILAVSQPDTDGQTPIPKTVDEVKALIKAVDDTTGIELKWLNGAQATKEAVLSGMESSTWVHLACHARQYPLRTSESAFMLANGETLSLADISGHAAAHGELAFLSACQTAAGDFDISEEGIHLAAGMLVTGYHSVIATTWSVRDQDAPVVAEAVYRRLLDGGQVNRTGTALALHHATRLLREKVGEDKVMLWAPFIHHGI